MAKLKTTYVCQNCGAVQSKWMGKCPECNQWNSLVEEVIEKQSSSKSSYNQNYIPKNTPVILSNVAGIETHRFETGIKELDQVLGGGIVKGSVVLIGGEPGIGKSTVILQVAGILNKKNKKVLYVSGEESPSQIRMRADRLNVTADNLELLTTTSFEDVLSATAIKQYDYLIIDSIQTITSEEIISGGGAVGQIRHVTYRLVELAKSTGLTVFIIGQVTKDGNIAGPKVLEHLVDTVLYFEGDRYDSYRILRAVKNRFGSTNEIGIFEMKDKGFEEVKNPSGLFLNREGEETGCCVACILEGTRPMLIEIQALVSDSSFGNPRRMATGIDYNRMIMLTAVLEKKCGMIFANQDMYMNVIGGLKIIEPSADLSIICAICSSFKDKKIDNNIIIIGEVSLTGEVRGISNIDKRINEAEKLGFKKAIIPFSNFKSLKKYDTIDIIPVKTVSDALKEIFE